MKIVIEFIPSTAQRYSTSGDYWIDDKGDWQIRISRMSDNRSELSVLVHELVEMILVIKRGIPIEDIDSFDIQYEKERPLEDESEPGDSKLAPYHEEHTFSTAIERMICESLKLSWKEHERVISESST